MLVLENPADRLPAAQDWLHEGRTTDAAGFFHTPAHFDLLERELRAQRPASMAAWSAVASSGDEAYSLAMLLSDLRSQGRIGGNWSVLATEASEGALYRAIEGAYPAQRLRNVDAQRIRRHCLQDDDRAEGMIRVGPELRRRVRFRHLDLCRPLDTPGRFDVVFLHSVPARLELEARCAVIDRVLGQLRTGGLFFTSTSEGPPPGDTPLQWLGPGAFRKAG